MERAQFQVLILPYRKQGDVYQFAAFKRTDLNVWQGLAGGGDFGESILDAAKREAFEEANIPATQLYTRLQTECSIPTYHFAARKNWSKNLLVIPEYSFGVDCTGLSLEISREHLEYKWDHYDEIHELFCWDSNKTAIWELNERLKNKMI
jgi:dihydroneopterin triphosphate diphosphatase